MACFIVPATEAVVTTVISKVAKNHKSEKNSEFAESLKSLNGMLWGGSALLAFEHLWHGEISPVFPFLTAMSDPAETTVMLHEMSTSGVAMAVVVTVVWGAVCIAKNMILKKSAALLAEEGGK